MEITQTETDVLEVGLLKKNESELRLIDSDIQIEKVAKALSSKTRRQILLHIKVHPMDVSNIASVLSMTEANISAQIKKLENAGLIICSYKSGDHGVRKISSLKYNCLKIKL